MKRVLMLLAACALACGAARAGTQTTSREAVLYIVPTPPTGAVSREATLYIVPWPPTTAVSREATLYIAAMSTRAASREATLFVNYRLNDVVHALRIAAGFNAATAEDKQRLNVVVPTASVVDILDAALLSRYVADPRRLP